jgi:hypothetical protein
VTGPAPAAGRWRLATLLAIAVLVAGTGGSVLATPQLEPDDYRFLVTLENLASGRIGWLAASVVENRWDHLWWLEAPDAVRFFRPGLVGSYWLDHVLHGGSARGLLLTNLILHAGTCAALALLAFRLVRAPAWAFAASVLYAAFACHAETMWYVAGRNETLAALACFGGLLLHGSDRRRLRCCAPIAYAFALLSKELTLGLPLLCLLWDVQVRERWPTWRAALVGDRWLWCGYVGVALGVAALRNAALPAGPNLVFPYFVAPWHPGFPGHVLAAVRNYAENLAIARLTLPFLQPERYAEFTSVGGTAVAAGGLVALVAALWRERRARWAAALALVTWLPTSVVYTSERYLVMPAAGLALAVGLAGARAGGRWRWIAALLLAGWGLHQTTWLYRKNAEISHRVRDAAALRLHLRQHGDALRDAKAVCLLDLPGGTLHAQFAAVQVRHATGRLDLPVHVLTTYPMARGRDAGFDVLRRDGRTIELRSQAPFAVAGPGLFPPVPLRSGTIVDRAATGVVAEVVAGDGERATALRFTLPCPLADCVLLRWLPPSPYPAGAPHGVIAAAGRMVRVRP